MSLEILDFAPEMQLLSLWNWLSGAFLLEEVHFETRLKPNDLFGVERVLLVTHVYCLKRVRSTTLDPPLVPWMSITVFLPSP